MDEAIEQNRPYREPLRRPVVSRINTENEVNYRIKWWMGIAIITVAIFTDLVELLITWIGVIKIGGILSMVVSIVMGFVFWVWFMLLGLPTFSNPRNFAIRLGTFIGEVIPFLDAIPFLSWLWTIGAIATVIITRSEDEGGAIGKAFANVSPQVAGPKGLKNIKPIKNYRFDKESVERLKEQTRLNKELLKEREKELRESEKRLKERQERVYGYKKGATELRNKNKEQNNNVLDLKKTV